MTYINEITRQSIEKINSEADKIKKVLGDVSNENRMKSRLHKILVWGDYGCNKPRLEKVVNALRKEGYTAFLQEDLKGGVKITDYQCSVELIEKRLIDLVILVDGSSIGTGIECGLAIPNEELQYRTIFLTSRTFSELCDVANPYHHYPIYERYQNDDDLAEVAVGMAIKETYRRIKLPIKTADDIN